MEMSKHYTFTPGFWGNYSTGLVFGILFLAPYTILTGLWESQVVMEFDI